jgi:two-component system, chemotaxis family, chemotaxis protein CheY
MLAGNGVRKIAYPTRWAVTDLYVPYPGASGRHGDARRVTIRSAGHCSQGSRILLKILIVDDSRTIRAQVVSALVPAGFEVLEAQDGIEALETINVTPDLALIIVDLNMPRMNGLELLDAIRGTLGRNVRSVMLTTEARPEVMEKGKRAGAKGWLVKPFKSEHLVSVARRLTIADTLTLTGTTFVFPR